MEYVYENNMNDILKKMYPIVYIKQSLKVSTIVFYARRFVRQFDELYCTVTNDVNPKMETVKLHIYKRYCPY